MAIDDLIQDAPRRMDKSVEAAQTDFSTLRTGRASPALLDRVQIDYYGQQTPLKQLATIGAPEPRLLTIQPFDPGSVATIERAIQESDLGLTPSNDGKLIRLPIPQLTEERRKELVKVVRQMAEDGKIAVRNVRRDAIHHLKELVDKGEAGSDEEHRAEERGLRVAEGDLAGTKALRSTVEAAIDLGLETLIVYAFSTENWSRPEGEVEDLMEIFGETIERELPDLARQGVRARFLGRRDRAPDELRAQ